MADGSIRVVVVDDHTLMREGLALLLGREPDLEMVAEGATAKSAMALVSKHKPDVLLLDLMLPDIGGMDVLRALADETNVLIVSMRNDPGFVAEAFRNGASGYVLKEDSSSDLVDAVHTVCRGKKYLSKQLDAETAQHASCARNTKAPNLTPRERDVLQLAATGQTSAEIGKQLSISPRTVEMHRTKALRKLGLTSQTELVRYAIRNRIISA